jgi:hypothetical protein
MFFKNDGLYIDLDQVHSWEYDEGRLTLNYSFKSITLHDDDDELIMKIIEHLKSRGVIK